jgi:D-xylose transport system permease protein
VARLGIPSFVVTLAMFLALQGLMLLIIGEGGTIAIRDDTVLALQNKNMPTWMGWVVWIVVVIGTPSSRCGESPLGARPGWPRWQRRSGRRRPVRSRSSSESASSSEPTASDRAARKVACEVNDPPSPEGCIPVLQGVPWAVLVILVLLVGLTFVLTRTGFGRHIYAVGGNAEAARRAGISVQGLKIACFMICSTLAAVAGVLIASRDNSVSPTTGGAQTLLFAVGAAVIGGTSLFGGRGRMIDAVIGGLVIAVIANGLPLVTQQSGIQYVVTGLVLLVAASVDAISRKRSSPS